MSAKIFSTFDPRKTLFARIFIWFWLAVTVMLIGAFGMARLVGEQWQVSALSDKQLIRIQELQNNIQQYLTRDPDIEKAVRRASARGRWQVLAINVAEKNCF